MLAKYTRFLKHFLRQITRLFKICYCFQGLNFRLAFAIAAGAFGSAWQHGYNTGVMNAPQKLIENWINSSSCTPETTPDDDTGKNFQFHGKIISRFIYVNIFCHSHRWSRSM